MQGAIKRVFRVQPGSDAARMNLKCASLSTRIRVVVNDGNCVVFTTEDYKLEFGFMGGERVSIPIDRNVMQIFDKHTIGSACRIHAVSYYSNMESAPPLHAFVDFFQEQLEGLVLLHLGFETAEQFAAFGTPDWLVGAMDVTNDPAYALHNLATKGIPPLPQPSDTSVDAAATALHQAITGQRSVHSLCDTPRPGY